MPRIFVSYRRSDTAMIVGRIYDHLERAFGRNNMFMDIDNIDPGDDFRDVIDDALRRSDLLIVLIGDKWLDVRDGYGNRRLDAPNDWVRTEIERGLQWRPQVRVIPLLVLGAYMPPVDQLPESIQDLAYLNAFKLDVIDNFSRDMRRLINFLRKLDATSPDDKTPLPHKSLRVVTPPDDDAPRDARPQANKQMKSDDTVSEAHISHTDYETSLRSPSPLHVDDAADVQATSSSTDTAEQVERPPEVAGRFDTYMHNPLQADIDDPTKDQNVDDENDSDDVVQQFPESEAALSESNLQEEDKSATSPSDVAVTNPTASDQWDDVLDLDSDHFSESGTEATHTVSDYAEPRSIFEQAEAPQYDAQKVRYIAPEMQEPVELDDAILDEDDDAVWDDQDAPSSPEFITSDSIDGKESEDDHAQEQIYESVPADRQLLTEFPEQFDDEDYEPHTSEEDTGDSEISSVIDAGNDSQEVQAIRLPKRQGIYTGRSGIVAGVVGLFVVAIMIAGLVFILSDSSDDPNGDADAAWIVLAQTGVQSNDEWTPYIRTFGEASMALVPIGCFEMGSNDGGSDEQPVHTQCIEEPFWIDVYEVTNAQYGELPPQGICRDRSSATDQPRNCVDWFDATAYCEARGGRLPTEAEWEYAARGPDSLVYPWGNDWNANNANWADTSPDETFAVGSFSSGVSWVGAQDLSGNVWEWTSTVYEDYPYDADDGREIDGSNSNRVLRGGSFLYSAYLLRAAARDGLSPSLVLDSVGFGFRCVRS